MLTISCFVAQAAQAQITITKTASMISIDGTRFADDVAVSAIGGDVVRVRANGNVTDIPCPVNGPSAPMIMFVGLGGDDDFVNNTRLMAIAFGGTGADRLVATTGAAIFFGEGGADFIVGSTLADTLDGGLGADEMYGFEGADDINAGGGADIVVGGFGNDLIEGGLGADLVFGQEGADTIRTGNGEDVVSGGLGNDFIEGGSNDDELMGGNSNDTIIGGLGDDVIIGGIGNDFLCGGRGADELRGGNGNDSLFGEEGVDVLLPGTGVDTLDQDSPGPCSFTGLALISTEVVFPRAQTRDLNSNGIIDGGDQFELDFLITAGPNGATGVAIGQNFTVVGPARRVGIVGETYPSLAPDQMVRTGSPADACIDVDDSANSGDEIFLLFDVTSDGQTGRFRVGPFVVGQITTGQANPAIRVTP